MTDRTLRALRAMGLGRVALGCVALGRVSLGRVALGRVSLGRVAIGRVAPGRVALGCAASALALAGAHSDASLARAAAPGDSFDLAAVVAAAPASSTVLVPPGIHAGPVVIDKALTLVGQGEAIIDGHGHGSVVVVTAPDVTVRGLVVRGSGTSLDKEDAGIVVSAARVTLEANRIEDALFGIYLKNAPGSTVRANVVRAKDLEQARMGDGIKLWYSGDSVLEDNLVTGSRDVIVWFSDRTTTRRNVVEYGRYGLHFMYASDQVVEDNVLLGNSVGIYLMYGHNVHLARNLMRDNRGASGYGLGIKDIDSATLVGNRMVGNRVGIYFDNELRGADVGLTFERNVVAHNEIGITFLPAVSQATFSANAFVDNGEQTSIAGSGTLAGNDWSVDGRGNFWSDYAGFDEAGDGVGDLPYVSQSLYEDLMAAHPGLRLFQLGPAADALDLAARAFPVFRPRAKVTDDAPLMRAPSLPPVPGLPAPRRAPGALAATGLLAMAALILVAGAGGGASVLRGAAGRRWWPSAARTESGVR